MLKMCRIQSSLWVLVLILSACTVAKEVPSELEAMSTALSTRPTKCTYGHAFDMYGAHCAAIGLTAIPSLKTSIEILDFSDNKLRELHSDTLSSYTSLMYLYLADNQIYYIEEEALSSLTSLQSLDLSNNVILDLPTSLFQLPALKKLILSGNPLVHVSTETHIGKPIKAPLDILDISNCKLTGLPYWGVLPRLLLYNVSYNPLTTLDADHFAAMCNLEKVDITDSIDKINVCSLKPAIEWFKEKRVYFQLKDFTRLNSDGFKKCVNTEEMQESLNITYHSCKREFLHVEQVRQSRRTWLTIIGGLAGFLVGFILLLYIMHRHNVMQTKSTAEKAKIATPVDGDKRATAVLLSNIVTERESDKI